MLLRAPPIQRMNISIIIYLYLLSSTTNCGQEKELIYTLCSFQGSANPNKIYYFLIRSSDNKVSIITPCWIWFGFHLLNKK
jgi:hypothetical protein